MTEYVYTEHSITDAVKLQTELINAGDLLPIFAINTDVCILSDLSQSVIDDVVDAAGE